MGSGKSSWAIQTMNDTTDSYIYCTPFLDEVDRIKLSCKKRHFYEPTFYHGRKIDDFNLLLMEGKDISVTHCTFANSNKETLKYLKGSNYTLILDEVLDVLVRYNDATNDTLSKADIKLLLNEKFISVDDYGKVSWLKDSYPGGKYFNVERLAKSGHLFYLDKTMLVWQFPPEIFSCFKKVYVLTYLFRGSLLKPYFEYHGLGYEMASVELKGSRYQLTKWSDDKAKQKEYASLIQIHNNAKMNNFNDFSLSKSWWEKQKKYNKDGITAIQRNTRNYFRNICKSSPNEIMWTTFKDYHGMISGKGYTRIRNLTPEEKQLPTRQLNRVTNMTQCFVACNARATNDFAERTTLAYLINRYCDGFTKRYFSNKNHIEGTDIHLDEDYFALSCMLQWIWRSQIRNGKPINIYIPSSRMRNMLEKWLHGEM